MFISTESFGQDSADSKKTDNKWFTEFQIANSSGFTINFLEGANLAIGRRVIKNTDVRLLFGFQTYNENVNTDQSYYVISGNRDSESDRYSAGIDILYRFRIVEDLIFKT